MLKNACQECLAWYATQNVSFTASLICSSRDVFQGRLDHMHKELAAKSKEEAQTALLSAVAGEIGNNCFDHNLGQWQDIPGCWFQYGFETSPFWILIADRGQGVLSSLKRVAPSLSTDQEALETAFSKKLSGRSLERRGNGLKFVRSIIHGNQNRGLLFISGKGSITFGGFVKPLEDLQKNVQWNKGQGTLACVLWSGDHEAAGNRYSSCGAHFETAHSVKRDLASSRYPKIFHQASKISSGAVCFPGKKGCSFSQQRCGAADSPLCLDAKNLLSKCLAKRDQDPGDSHECYSDVPEKEDGFLCMGTKISCHHGASQRSLCPCLKNNRTEKIRSNGIFLKKIGPLTH